MRRSFHLPRTPLTAFRQLSRACAPRPTIQCRVFPRGFATSRDNLPDPVRLQAVILPQNQLLARDIRKVQTHEIGFEGSREHALFFLTPDRFLLSPWHDVPLFPLYSPPSTEFLVVNAICHMPMRTSERYEVKLAHAHNPIGPILAKPKFPLAKPNPAFIRYSAMPYNECSLPQTWNDPDELVPYTKHAGDDTTASIIDVGTVSRERGAIFEAKLLGVTGVLEDTSLRIKFMAIALDDPNAELIDTIEELKNVMPGRLEEIMNFLKMYRTADGGAENSFAWSGEIQPLNVANEVLMFFNRNYRHSAEESWDIGYKNPGESFKWATKRATHFDDILIKIT